MNDVVSELQKTTVTVRRRRVCERLTDKKTSATADSLRIRVFGVGSRETKQRVVRWGTVNKFSKGRSG